MDLVKIRIYMCMFSYLYLRVFICINNYCIKLRENTSRDVSAVSIFESSSSTFICGFWFFLKHYVSVV